MGRVDGRTDGRVDGWKLKVLKVSKVSANLIAPTNQSSNTNIGQGAYGTKDRKCNLFFVSDLRPFSKNVSWHIMLERISKPDSHDMHNFTGVSIQFQPTEQIFFGGRGEAREGLPT